MGKDKVRYLNKDDGQPWVKGSKKKRKLNEYASDEESDACWQACACATVAATNDNEVDCKACGDAWSSEVGDADKCGDSPHLASFVSTASRARKTEGCDKPDWMVTASCTNPNSDCDSDCSFKDKVRYLNKDDGQPWIKGSKKKRKLNEYASDEESDACWQACACATVAATNDNEVDCKACGDSLSSEVGDADKCGDSPHLASFVSTASRARKTNGCDKPDWMV